MLFKLYLIVSFVGDVLVTVFGDLINSFADIWKPILLFVGLFFACLIVHVILILIFAPFCREVGKVFKPMKWIVHETADILLKLIRVKVHTTGMDMIPKDERFFIVSNHKTFFDPIIGMKCFAKNRISYVAKKDLLKIPVGKNIVIGSGCLPLDRENDRAAVKTIIQAANIIKSGELSMGIYPEGGTNKTDEPLLPFRNGAFKIAQRAGCPIVIATIYGTENILKRMILRRTDIYLDVLKVLPYDEIAGLHTNEIGKIVYDIMLDNLVKHRSDLKD